MGSRIRVALLATCLALSAFAAAPPTGAEDAEGRLDVLYLAPGRPTRLRVRVLAGGRPYTAAWLAWTDKLFDHFDRDGDGVLRATEAANIPDAFALVVLLGDGVLAGPARGATLAKLDADKNGFVSREEFRGHLRRNFMGPVRAGTSPDDAANSAAETNAFFRLLDTDGDGRLSRAELAKTAERLVSLDANDDEIVSRGELGPRPAARTRRGWGGHITAGGDDERLWTYDAGRPPAAATAAALSRYDADKDGKLSPREIALRPREFASADADGDGSLSHAELAGWLAGGADRTFTTHVGPLPTAAAVVEAAGAWAWRVGPTQDLGGPTLTAGDARLALRASADDPFGRGRQLQTFLREFDALAGPDGRVARQRIVDDQGALSPVFAAADRDSDGALTRDELTAFVALVGEGATSAVTLRLRDDGRDLYRVLAGDGGRLTARRMRDAWASVAPLCADRDKGLSRDDVPRRLTLTFMGGVREGATAPPAPPPFLRLPTPGPPRWFAKTDANGDGDVSRKEWLGTEADFAAIDADGDGLISAAEARAFEAKRRNAPR